MRIDDQLVGIVAHGQCHDADRVPLVAEAVAVLRGRLADAKAAAILSRGLSFAFRAHDLRRTAASYMGEAGVVGSTSPTC